MRLPTVAFAIATLTAAVLNLIGCVEEDLRPSVAEEIIGTYYLAERGGSRGGGTAAFTPADSPVDMTFDDEGGYLYVRRRGGVVGGADSMRGAWSMTEVARRGDTLSFRFDNRLPEIFRQRTTLLIDGDALVLPTPRTIPDVPFYVFRRR